MVVAAEFRKGYCNEESGGPSRTELYDECINLETKCTRDDCEELCRNSDISYPVRACEYAAISHNCVAVHGNVTGATISEEDDYECAVLGKLDVCLINHLASM